jgi:hypothetical protein
VKTWTLNWDENLNGQENEKDFRILFQIING